MNGKQTSCAILTAFSFLAIASCSGVEFPEASNALPAAEPDIDLANYTMTFEDGFQRVNVSGRRCDTQWIAHTPWNGDFGAAKFTDPSRRFPFMTKNGLLRIEARNDPALGWMSGILSGRNTCDEGFVQKYGYFEIRTMLPPGDGFWPAFWLVGVDRSKYTAEIDVFEHHGVRPDQFTATLHVHPRAEGVRRYNQGHIHKIPEDALYAGFNTFGVSVEEDDTIFYFNRKEIWRTETVDEFKQPLFMLFNLAMDAGEISDETPDRAHMYVDYVRVYKRKEP